MSSGLISRNIVFRIHCFRITTVIIDKWFNVYYNRVYLQRSEIVCSQCMVYINILLKTIHGRDRRRNLVIFVVWKVLIVGRWVVLERSEKPYLGPPEFASYVFLIYLRMGDTESVQDFIFFFRCKSRG